MKLTKSEIEKIIEMAKFEKINYALSDDRRKQLNRIIDKLGAMIEEIGEN